jgi:hypothetical protein
VTTLHSDLFAACIDEGDDSDYNLYKMPDQGCAKTRAAGGCEKRRCAKTNTYNKICDKDNAAPTGSCSIGRFGTFHHLVIVRQTQHSIDDCRCVPCDQSDTRE